MDALAIQLLTVAAYHLPHLLACAAALALLWVWAQPSPGRALAFWGAGLLFGSALLQLAPNARAILLHAPLEDFLGSIARKGMWGRLWVRDLLCKYLREAGVIDFGLSTEDILQLTDIQVAALGWLAQHRIFTDLATRLSDRVATLDSDTLMEKPGAVIRALSGRMALGLSESQIGEIVEGPAFTRHSKSGGTFDAAARRREREEGLALHAEEIAMVRQWAAEVADRAGIRLELPRPLL